MVCIFNQKQEIKLYAKQSTTNNSHLQTIATTIVQFIHFLYSSRKCVPRKKLEIFERHILFIIFYQSSLWCIFSAYPIG